MSNAYDRLRGLYADYNALQAALSLLNWDRQVLMPSGGSVARTAHEQTLCRLAHELITSEEMLYALAEVEATADPLSEAAMQAAALRREVDTEVKLPSDLVARKSRVSSEAYQVWRRAKFENDFASMVPYYRELFDLAYETAQCLGYTDHVYDPLINLYEPGATYADAESMFAAIKSPIVDLVQRTHQSSSQVDDSLLSGGFGIEELRSVAESIQHAIGFRADEGRLNVAANAFCMNLSCGDVRMTTRASNHIKGILSSSLHEMGHALYEQNSPREWDRTPLAGGISLAVHESQSRLWENIVGRSRGFWQHFFPLLSKNFPVLKPLGPEGYYRAINRVHPEFIRVGADELTYNLHILIRFELEVEILTKQLEIEDLPAAWNQKYHDYLGIDPPSNTEGCLQDVHWSKGSIGYFPTYAMGNLIGAQMWACLERDLGDTQKMMSDGDFAPILSWLTDKVYRRGKSLLPKDLVTHVTGRPMEAGDWLRYANRKYTEIYHL